MVKASVCETENGGSTPLTHPNGLDELMVAHLSVKQALRHSRFDSYLIHQSGRIVTVASVLWKHEARVRLSAPRPFEK